MRKRPDSFGLLLLTAACGRLAPSRGDGCLLLPMEPLRALRRSVSVHRGGISSTSACSSAVGAPAFVTPKAFSPYQPSCSSPFIPVTQYGQTYNASRASTIASPSMPASSAPHILAPPVAGSVDRGDVQPSSEAVWSEIEQLLDTLDLEPSSRRSVVGDSVCVGLAENRQTHAAIVTKWTRRNREAVKRLNGLLRRLPGWPPQFSWTALQIGRTPR